MIKLPIQELLVLDEGLKLRPYLCTSNFWTIGIGRNLEKKGLSKSEQIMIFNEYVLDKNEIIEKLKITGISKEQAYILLDNDISYFTEKLSQFDWFLRLSEVRKAVIISMAFNIGLNGFFKFKNLIKSLENDYHDIAAVEMLKSKWAKQVKNRAIRLAKMMETNEWPPELGFT